LSADVERLEEETETAAKMRTTLKMKSLLSVYKTRRDAVVRADEGRLPPRRADRTGTRSTADREAR
jgi:hypothetical protein